MRLELVDANLANNSLGWQWVALGALIVITVVYFQDGLMGWLRTVRPEWFGVVVDKKEDDKAVEAAQ